MTQPGDDTREPLERAFDELLDAAERGDAAALEAIGARHPEMSSEVRERLAELARGGAATTRFGSASGFGDDASIADLPFDRIGDFRILRPLARGGMSVLYLAEQTSLRRRVAVKLLSPERWSSSAAQATFRREAETLAALRHPGIVMVHACGVERGVPWLAMELLEGRTLEAVIAEARDAGKPIAVARALRLAAQVARALACSHAAGVMHRDVKPSNVFVAPGDRAVLLDFGIARAVAGEHLTRTGEFRGTPSYASPEQIAPSSAAPIDHRTDVYSLGVTLYEILTGHVPFAGETTEQVFHQILHRDPIAPRRRNPAVPRDVEIVVMKALEKNPARRYASAEEFAADLDALLEIRPIRARPSGPLAQAWKWMRRNRASSTALAALVVLSIAAPAWLRYRDRARGEDRIADAERSIADLAAQRRKLHDVEARAVPLEMAVNRRYLEPAEHRTIAESREERAAIQRSLDAAFFGALGALDDVRRLLPGDGRADRLRADLYLERWRRASEERDASGMALFRELVESLDREGRHAAELRPRRALTIVSDPPGAAVHLFRFEEQAALAEGGDRRLVPVPIAGDGSPLPTPRPPGSRALSVVEAAGDLWPGDVVLSVAGRPIDGVLLVPHDSADGDLRAFDRLLEVDGRPMREAYDVTSLYDRLDPETLHAFAFERDGVRFERKAASLDALDIKAWEPDNVLDERGGRVEVWRDGTVRTLDAPAVTTITTAAPLFLSEPAGRAGDAPLADVGLEPGSYLAVLRLGGCDDQRVPFVVERDRDPHVEATLVVTGASPPDFTWIPGGTFVSGGDPLAFAGFERREVALDGFWIQKHEVVWRDWLRFLNDPAVQRRIADSPEPILVPRGEDGAPLNAKWKRGDDGSFAIPPGRALFPLSGVSWDDAVLYARWLTEQFRTYGKGWEFALPTELEWEKAARGVDGRAFPFGDRFSPQWVKSHFAHATVEPEFGLRFPIDESPYGVFDACGGEWEWCADEWGDDTGSRTARGGAWDFIYEANFRCASRAAVSPANTTHNLGIRLVAHLRKDGPR